MSAPADLELIQRIMEETGVDQTVPPPSWSGYVQALAEALVEWLRSHLPGLQGLSSVSTRLGPLAVLVGAVLIALILYALARMALLARRSRGRATPAAAPALPDASSAPGLDRAGWRGEIDRRLGAGDLDGTLEALWWWFARSVSEDGVDPSWTSHELLVRCRRTDLAPFARVLDRLLYGFERPGANDVRLLLGRLEAVLP